MKTIVTKTHLMLLVVVGATATHSIAQSLNYETALKFSLSGYANGTEVLKTNSAGVVTTTWTIDKFKITNKEIIEAIGAGLGTTFSSTAELIQINDVWFVRDGGNRTDVSSMFEVGSEAEVSSGKETENPPANKFTSNSTEYSADWLHFDNQPMAASLAVFPSALAPVEHVVVRLNAFVTTTESFADNNGSVTGKSNATAASNGFGTVGEEQIVLSGTVKITSKIVTD